MSAEVISDMVEGRYYQNLQPCERLTSAAGKGSYAEQSVCHRWVPEVPLRPRPKMRLKVRPNRNRSSLTPSCKGEFTRAAENSLVRGDFLALRPAPCSESRLEMPGLKEGRTSPLRAQQVQDLANFHQQQY